MNWKDLYEYNKKIIWLGIITLIVLVIGLVFYFKKDDGETETDRKTEVLFKDDYNLVLFGSDVITIYQNEKYQEPGYYAILNNEIVSSEVKVNNPVDVTKPGTYEITYTYRTIIKTRTINVLEKEEEKDDDEKVDNKEDDDKAISLKLKGDSEINLKLNEVYKELGAIATDKNGKDISNKISITGNINTSKVGTYKIIYSINYDGIKKSIERTINVIDKTVLSLSNVDSSNYTNKDIVIKVKAEGSDFLYLKFPDNTVSKDNSKDYTITENGTYTFYAYDRDNSYVKKSITISNIDKIKPSGSCKAVINSSITTITVSATDNVGIDHYVYNGLYSSKSTTYTINSSNVSAASVTVYDKAGNKNVLSCSISSSGGETKPVVNDGNLEIHLMLSGHDDDAILIRTNNKTIMIDGGRYEDKNKVIPYLQGLGVKTIDLMIGSHVHYNHIQAQAAILDNFDVKQAIYSLDLNTCKKNGYCDAEDIKYILDGLKKHNTPFKMVEPGTYLELGEMKLYFIGPTLKNKKHNKNSFVFILQFRDTKYMFMGDCSNSVLDTSKFLSYASKWNMNIDVDLLKWPHHGYNDLSETFFKEITPKYALVPNGSSCSSKYPSSHNKSLTKKYNTKVYQTCEYGNIVVISDGKNIDIKTHQKASTYKR